MKSRLRAAVLATAVFHGVTCASMPSQSPSGAVPDEPEQLPFELLLLKGYPGASDAEALSALDREVESNRLFDEGTEAYKKGNLTLATRRFLEAAEPLLVPPSSFNGDIMTENRLICYTNAALSLRQASQFAEARAKLQEALARDPDNAAGISKLLRDLPPSR